MLYRRLGNISLYSKCIIISCIIILLLFCRTLNNHIIKIPTIEISSIQSLEENDFEHEAEEAINVINERQIKVVKGDKFVNILQSYGINKQEIYQLLPSLAKVYNIGKIYEGQLITLTTENHDKLRLISLEIEIDPMKKVIVIHNDHGGFDSRIITNIRHKKLKKLAYPVEGSLFASAIANGLSEQVTMNLINLYSKKINLNRDIRDGSQFEILLEQFVDENGNFSHYGNIIYTSIMTRNKKEVKLYRYTTKSGNDGYFYANGDYVNNKSQLRLPLANVRISSKFGTRRHPISKKITFHKGVDLAAPTGTPVYSAGDGIVEYIGNRGGYGKYIRIKHNDYYSTAYAHLSQFTDRLKVGAAVKAGEVIAKSGKTGLATGPHLHYEVLYKNKQVDPMNTVAKIAKLEGDEFQHFKKFVHNVKQALQQTDIDGLETLYKLSS